VDQTTDQGIRQLRVVHVSVCAGILVFLGVATVLKGTLVQAELSERISVLLGGLALVAAACAAAYLAVDRVAVARVARACQESPKASDGVAIAAYRQLAIVSAALIEGPCFLACMVYLLTGSGMAVGAVALGLALLLSRMPSQEGLQRFVERARES